MKRLTSSFMSALIFVIFALGMAAIAVFGSNPYVNICLVVLLVMATLGGVTMIHECNENKEESSVTIS